MKLVIDVVFGTLILTAVGSVFRRRSRSLSVDNRGAAFERPCLRDPMARLRSRFTHVSRWTSAIITRSGRSVDRMRSFCSIAVALVVTSCAQPDPIIAPDSGGGPTDAGSACAPISACAAAGSFCQDSTTVVTCAVDKQGCYTATPTMCPPDESCSGVGPTASCECVNAAPCVKSGPSCSSATEVATCTPDANGCLTVTASSTCSDQQSCAGEPGFAACGCNPAAGPDASHGVFVDATTGNDASGLGTSASPYATISRGIVAAAADGVPNVYVGPGQYLENVTVLDSTAGVSIQGGWTVINGMWGQDCGASPRTNTVLHGGAIGMRVTGVVHASGLARMTVETSAPGTTANNTDGASTIGILITGDASRFSLDDVVVIAENAGNGGAASNGDAGLAASYAGGGYCGTGLNGVTPAAGASATNQGLFTAGGFMPADGAPGAMGAHGMPGNAGGNGSCVSLYNYMGGCGHTTGGYVGQSCGSQGRCGAGGGGGYPGWQGHGGGASVAILLNGIGATLTISNSSLRSGDGGAGSVGGSGGVGGAASLGGVGTQTCNSSSTTCSATGTCGSIFDLQTYYTCTWGTVCGAGGAPGGPGGLGGNGSSGGAGAGGPSYAIVTLAGATATADTGTTLTFGAGGAGAGSAPAGSAAAMHSGP